MGQRAAPRPRGRGGGRDGPCARRVRYAEQDRFYSAPWIRRYHDGFEQAGGTAALHVFPAFGGDGHRLVDRAEIWSAAAAEFLRRLNVAAP